MMLKSFSIANLFLLSVYFIISLRIPSTTQVFWGWKVGFCPVGHSRKLENPVGSGCLFLVDSKICI